MSDLTTVSRPCDLPDTPENRARIAKAFHQWAEPSDDETWIGTTDGNWQISVEWEIDSYESDNHVYRVLVTADGGLTFEEVR